MKYVNDLKAVLSHDLLVSGYFIQFANKRDPKDVLKVIEIDGAMYVMNEQEMVTRTPDYQFAPLTVRQRVSIVKKYDPDYAILEDMLVNRLGKYNDAAGKIHFIHFLTLVCTLLGQITQRNTNELVFGEMDIKLLKYGADALDTLKQISKETGEYKDRDSVLNTITVNDDHHVYITHKSPQMFLKYVSPSYVVIRFPFTLSVFNTLDAITDAIRLLGQVHSITAIPMHVNQVGSSVKILAYETIRDLFYKNIVEAIDEIDGITKYDSAPMGEYRITTTAGEYFLVVIEVRYSKDYGQYIAYVHLTDKYNVSNMYVHQMDSAQVKLWTQFTQSLQDIGQ